MIPTKNTFRRALLFGLMFAFAGGAFLSGCSSSDSASSGSCAEKCAGQGMNEDECLIGCEA